MINSGLRAAVHCVIAILFEVFGQRPNDFGQMYFGTGVGAAMVVGADCSLVHSGNHSRSARRAHRCSDVGVREPGTLAGKTVDVRRADGRFAVAAKVRRHIFGNYPEDVGPMLSACPIKSVSASVGQQTGKGKTGIFQKYSRSL